MDILDRLLEYDCWIMHRVLEHCAQLSDEQRHQRFDIGWETVVLVNDGKVDVMLGKAELAWLQACWQAATFAG